MVQVINVPVCIFGDSNTWGAWDKNGNYIEKDIITYNKKLEELSMKTGAKYVNSDALGKDDLSEDGVHLSSLGHAKLFNAVKDFLIKEKWILT